jgi:hypothetical protein
MKTLLLLLIIATSLSGQGVAFTAARQGTTISAGGGGGGGSFSNVTDIASLHAWHKADGYTQSDGYAVTRATNFAFPTSTAFELYSYGDPGILTNSLQNAKPGVYYNGSTRYNIRETAESYTDCAVIVVARLDGAADAGDFIFGATYPTWIIEVSEADSTKVAAHFGAGADYGAWTIPNRAFAFGFLRTGSTLITFTDDGTRTTNTISADPISPNAALGIGANPQSLGGMWRGWQFESVLATNTVTYGLFESVFNGLTNKWGVHP